MCFSFVKQQNTTCNKEQKHQTITTSTNSKPQKAGLSYNKQTQTITTYQNQTKLVQPIEIKSTTNAKTLLH
jgi:hypothetical protein